MPQLRVGCSGWQYRDWRGAFYPRDLPSARWLQYYSGVFDTVEVNNTFYRLPAREAFAAWREGMPPFFVAAIKASRFLTHMKKLLAPEEPLERLFDRLVDLGPRLGPVLYQLPATLRLNPPRLEAFLRHLPHAIPAVRDGRRRRRVQHVVEFRHPSWYVPEVFERLAASRTALCLHDRAGSGISRAQVGPFVYVRFHGESGAYHGAYSGAALDRHAGWLADQYRAGLDVYAYFNNDVGAAAAGNALTLRAQIRRRLGLTG